MIGFVFSVNGLFEPPKRLKSADLGAPRFLEDVLEELELRKDVLLAFREIRWSSLPFRSRCCATVSLAGSPHEISNILTVELGSRL
jgi:hypothetical protein